MFWIWVIAVVLVVSLVLRRVLRRRRSPNIDGAAFNNANYARVNQEVRNFDQRYGQG